MEDVISNFIPMVFLAGVFTLIGMKMHYRQQDKRVSGSSQQEGQQLAAAVDNLTAEFELLRNEVNKLDERMDFTERLLERPKTEK